MQHPKLIPWIAKLTFLAVIIALIAAPYIFTPYTTAAQDSGRVELVPNDWSLKPADIGPGERFRLIFLSSTKRNATSSNIDTYNSFVQNLAANGHVAIQNYSSRFRVVGCTTTVDARDNTRTTPIGNAATIKKGVPIYWLGGNKVADDYTDFYDSTWDDEANDKNESGNDAHDTSQSNNFPFTGCDADGTEARDGAASLALSSSTGVVVGQLNSTTWRQPPSAASPMLHVPTAVPSTRSPQSSRYT